MKALRYALCAATVVPAASLSYGQYGSEEVLLNISRAEDCLPIDGDLDGDLDLVVCTTFGVIRYLENIGDDTFGQPVDIGFSTPQPQTIDSHDLDGDGDADLLFSRSAGDFIWSRSLGNGAFSPPEVIEAAFAVRSAAVLDWDLDGDLDILAANGSTVGLFENSNGSFGPMQTFLSGLATVESTASADLNSDGIRDLIVASGSTVAWYPGATSSTFGAEERITTGAGGVSDVIATDLNGDGFLDVAVSASGDGEVAWFPGDGTGGFGSQQLVDVSAAGVREVRALDFNGDGLMDLLAGPISGTYVVYENVGFGFFNVPLAVVMNGGALSSFRFADLDGDADLDVVTAAFNANRVSFFRNLATLGMTYCTSNANSTGFNAELAVTGSDKVADNAVVLTTTELPPASFGFYVTSQSAGMVNGPGGSQGILCLGGGIGRYVGPGQIQFSGAIQQMQLAIDLQSMPAPMASVSAAAGQTWHFQTWYRDTVSGSATSNFSDAVSVLLR